MIRNLVEEHVRQSLEALKGHFPGFCPCGEEQCTEDVLVYALNRIPPRYVTTREGQAVTEVALEKQQQRAEIDVVVMEAL
ncbi:MAG TPA: late competence development ComFB family protein, partial [Gemmatimonadales bacterium]|nr:late competence development ComFB family protein [Gemmatimonadales bacterium]